MAARAGKSKRTPPIRPARIPMGVVGLGLMGTSIVACLLAAGHPVVAVTSAARERRTARRRLTPSLRQSREEGRTRASVEEMLGRFEATDDYAKLEDCDVVLETIIEDLEAKRAVIAAVEERVSPRTLIGSNTSALPITQLQARAKRPERVLGVHWALPAHLSRFMEVIRGEKTRPAAAQRILLLARRWGKRPTLVRKDVRGFVCNRIGYAMLREAFHLVESGVATPADVDRALRYTLGTWVPFAGPFRIMDLNGLPTFLTVMRDLVPELSNQTPAPALLERLVESGAAGIRNGRGFYRYTPAEVKRWEKAYREFGREIVALADKYEME